jgi:hypothetical protein
MISRARDSLDDHPATRPHCRETCAAHRLELARQAGLLVTIVLGLAGLGGVLTLVLR